MGATGFDIAALAGPYGGMLAGAFAFGCAAGFAFCVKTLLKMAEMERTACEEQMNDMSARIRELEDRSFHQMERQLGQIRQSSQDVLGRDR